MSFCSQRDNWLPSEMAGRHLSEAWLSSICILSTVAFPLKSSIASVPLFWLRPLSSSFHFWISYDCFLFPLLYSRSPLLENSIHSSTFFLPPSHLTRNHAVVLFFFSASQASVRIFPLFYWTKTYYFTDTKFHSLKCSRAALKGENIFGWSLNSKKQIEILKPTGIQERLSFGSDIHDFRHLLAFFLMTVTHIDWQEISI